LVLVTMKNAAKCDT